MKGRILTIIFLSSFFCLSIKGQSIVPSKPEKTSHSIVDVAADSIVIISDSTNPNYQLLSSFRFTELDSITYRSSLVNPSWLRKRTKLKPEMKWTKWIQIKKYKGSFYAYKPCDFLYHARQSFNDSTFIDYTVEGPIGSPIASQHWLNSHTYRIETLAFGKEKRSITIHIIDHKKGIAVFEETFSTGEATFSTMIAAEKIKSLPLLINNCPFYKKGEVTFDNIDYKAQLKKKKVNK